MELKRDWILSSSILSFVFGAHLFAYGFFPLSHSSDERASLTDLPDFIDCVALNKSVYTRHVSRIVFMVIDALRTDFVQTNGSMRYTNDLINDGSACYLNVEVESPTVTMPRIKAMTTGTIPNFIDVVLNLGSSKLNIDSLLHQISDGDGKIVFAGDNTWTKMFPNLFERKYENEDSLYVNDFVEGDRNITRILIDELRQFDWQLLVLHFLGLDHIGHVEGPFSDKVPPKLAEMDAIVSNIHLNMQKWNRVFPEPAMLIVTGDHGMRDVGGHGGSSYAEMNVPLVVVGQKCAGRIRESYKQIDIAPTIAALLALPIPASSIGALIPEMLADLSMEHQLYAFHYNAKRLMDKLILAEVTGRIGNTEIHAQFGEAKIQHKTFIQSTDNRSNSVNVTAFKRAKMLYVSAAKAMSEQLAKFYINYDDFSITTGFAVLFISLLNIFHTHTFSMHPNPITVPLKWLAAIAVVAFGGHLKFVESDTHFYSQSLNFAAICSLLAFIITLFVQIIHLPSIEQGIFRASRMWPPLCRFLLFGVLFHAISYASSSFIEEEHQTWYYLTSTALIAFYLMETRSLFQSLQNSKDTSKQSIRYRQLKWISLFGANLIARRLNQTGDKWLMQSDIGDWLKMDEHRFWNSIFVFASLCSMFLNCVDFGDILTNVLTLTACVLIYYFRTIAGFVYFTGIQKSESTCLILFGLNFIEIVVINVVPVIYRCITHRLQKFDVKLMLGTTIILFALISALTHKPHNIFLVGVQIVTCRMVNESCNRLFSGKSKSANAFAQCATHYWIGKQFFFYQGNSNSLASIDINAGYIGLQSFDFVTVAILLTINTFSGPILSILLLAYNIYQCQSDATKQSHKTYRNERRETAIDRETCELNDVLPIIPILFAFPFVVYAICALAFRNHIFVWTVFSPKLLYEFYHLCLMVTLWLLLYFIPQVK